MGPQQRMIVSVGGDVTARCPACGGIKFGPLLEGQLRLDSVLVCSRCAATTTYRELLDQIGEEAMKRANESLDKLQTKRGRPRKPRK